MTNRTIKTYQFLFILTLLFLFIFMVSRTTQDIIQKYESNVVLGTVVVDNSNLDKSLELTGTYRIIEDKIVNPADIEKYKNKIKSLTVYDNGALLKGNYATIVFTVYNYSGQDLTLQLSDFINNHKIFLNGIPYEYVRNENERASKNNTYIDLSKNSKTDVLIQIQRDDYFLFGFLKPPVIDTFSNVVTDFTVSQFTVIILAIVVFIFTLFLIIISSLRAPKITDNFSIIAFGISGLVVCARLISSVLVNYGIVSFYFTDFLKYRELTLVLIVYFTYLYIYYNCEQRKEIKLVTKIINYFVTSYLIFSFVCPPVAGELLYKFSLTIILGMEIAAFFVAQNNITEYKKNGIISFLVLAVNFIFAFTLTDIYLYSSPFTLVFSFLLSICIISSNLFYEIYNSYINFKYVTKKQNLQNEIFAKEIEKTNKLLNIETTAKNHAIRISEESKKRDIYTGLYNRFYTSNYIEDILNSVDDDRIISFILIDIDNLKYINTVYGHSVSDILISKISHLLLQYKSPQDFISRWAGGAFLMVFTNAEHGTATYIAETIRRNIEQITFHNNDTATVSVGVVSANNKASLGSIEQSLNEGIEKAKSLGRNCVYTNNTILSDKHIINENLIPATEDFVLNNLRSF